MPQGIEQIIQTDKRAREIVEKARIGRDEIMAEAKIEQEAALQESEKRLADLKANLDGENQRFVADARKEADALLAEKTAVLDEIYQKNEAAWCDEIFARIVNG
ncbi:MAG: hypothetical protein KBG54_03295 [Oscillospiraceae bacterium]|jgi:hypothetical protein|nr:hypothetical protein [Oscillospiraceae bacterium]